MKKLLRTCIAKITGYEIRKTYPDGFVLQKNGTHELYHSMGVSNYLLALRLQSIFQHHNINLLLDVGANEGQYAQTVRHYGYTGRIISFEPLSRTFEILKHKSAADPLWDVYNFALGSKDTENEIHVSDSSVFSSFLEANESMRKMFGEEAIGSKTETVKVRRLDTVLEEIANQIQKSNIYLKMDTQGYDLEVFAGLGSMTSHIAALQTEVSAVPMYSNMPHLTQSISLFEKAGFEIAGMYAVNADEKTFRTIEFDCLMINSANSTKD